MENFFSLIWIWHLGYLNAGGKVCNVVCGGVPSLQEHQFCHLPRQCSHCSQQYGNNNKSVGNSVVLKNLKMSDVLDESSNGIEPLVISLAT